MSPASYINFGATQTDILPLGGNPLLEWFHKTDLDDIGLWSYFLLDLGLISWESKKAENSKTADS